MGNDAPLRARLESLLRHHSEDRFLEDPVADLKGIPLPEPFVGESIGTVIGRYKLLQKIGEGGMGVVYMAQQEEPVRRRVALKIIKLGMDTKQVVARFEAERQALALMDHPNIAKVLDGGATDTGRPYFVMELVQGVPITEFCDRNRFPARERIKLFITVCQAIQSAHQKGIIHRDLKPTNILVTLDAGVPMPMVIDFGVAKATQQKLTEKTVFTELRHDDRHAGLHEPGAGRDEPSGRGYAQRHLRPGGAALRIADRDDAVPGEAVAERELPRDAADHPGGGAGTAFHAPEHAPGRAAEPGGQEPWGQRTGAGPGIRRRPGLDCDEMPGEGPGAPLRDGQWSGRRPQAASQQRTGRGPAAEHGLPTPEGHPPNKLAFMAGVAVAAALVLGSGISTWQAIVAQQARLEAEHQLYAAKMNLAQQAWDQNNIGQLRQLLEETQHFPRIAVLNGITGIGKLTRP